MSPPREYLRLPFKLLGFGETLDRPIDSEIDHLFGVAKGLQTRLQGETVALARGDDYNDALAPIRSRLYYGLHRIEANLQNYAVGHYRGSYLRMSALSHKRTSKSALPASS